VCKPWKTLSCLLKRVMNIQPSQAFPLKQGSKTWENQLKSQKKRSKAWAGFQRIENPTTQNKQELEWKFQKKTTKRAQNYEVEKSEEQKQKFRGLNYLVRGKPNVKNPLTEMATQSQDREQKIKTHSSQSSSTSQSIPPKKLTWKAQEPAIAIWNKKQTKPKKKERLIL